MLTPTPRTVALEQGHRAHETSPRLSLHCDPVSSSVKETFGWVGGFHTSFLGVLSAILEVLVHLRVVSRGLYPSHPLLLFYRLAFWKISHEEMGSCSKNNLYGAIIFQLFSGCELHRSDRRCRGTAMKSLKPERRGSGKKAVSQRSRTVKYTL